MQSVSAESVAPSQSSSTPFVQFSGGIVQLPQPHVPLHARVPVEPQLVVQLPVEPAQQANPLSQVPSQSSSAPLQISPGGTQLPHVHVELQLRLPVLPHPVVQPPIAP